MEYVSNKDIFLLMRDTLKLKEPAIVEHGYRVAYIVYRMLQCKGGYEMFELADIAIYATFHDFGACIQEGGGKLLSYDIKGYIPHSVYGFLICKYLSPHEEMAPVLLNHHIDYNRLKNLTPQAKELAAVFNIAERMDIYHNSLGDKFDSHIFDKLSGTKMWGIGMEWLFRAEREFRIFRMLENGSYLKEMDELLEYMIFSNEESSRYLDSLLYFLGVRSEYAVIDAATCMCVCRSIADRLLLSTEEKKILRYAALLHDVGMLAIPKEIIEAPRKLTDNEMQFLRTHVELVEKLLKNRVAPEVVEVILTHHERGDGSGYPRRLRDSQLNQLQRILQVADTYTALINERSYRPRKQKNEVIMILREEQRKGKFNKQLVDTIITFYDDIYEETRRQEAEVMEMYQKLVKDYEKLSKQFKVEE